MRGLFSGKLDRESGLLNVDKSFLLVSSMEDPEAKERTQDAVDCTSSFAETVKLLHVHYDDYKTSPSALSQPPCADRTVWMQRQRLIRDREVNI